ncbi:MAG: hypothetical protein N2746_00575 [Deltaproteobacteria bacterium]|nr:hypothetical protein [Deltaproteobacteria bacterium]
MDIIHNKKLFNQAVGDYFIFCDTKGVHRSLGKEDRIKNLLE